MGYAVPILERTVVGCPFHRIFGTLYRICHARNVFERVYQRSGVSSYRIGIITAYYQVLSIEPQITVLHKSYLLYYYGGASEKYYGYSVLKGDKYLTVNALCLSAESASCHLYGFEAGDDRGRSPSGYRTHNQYYGGYD